MPPRFARALLIFACALAAGSRAATVQVRLSQQANRESGVHLVSDAQVDRAGVGGLFNGFTATQPLPGPRARHAGAISGGYAYVLGGYDPAGAPGNAPTAVFYAPLSSAGTGGWKAATAAALPSGRLSAGAVAYNGFLYCAGGVTGGSSTQVLSEVLVARIGADGSPGGWKATTALPQQRVGMTLVALGNSLYSVGGDVYTGVLSSRGTTDVLVASIRADGTLGPWAATTSFSGTRIDPAIWAWGNRLYVASGLNKVDVQSAPVLSDGSVGTWVPTVQLSTSISGARAVAFEHYVALVGGTRGDGSLNGVLAAPILASGRLGSFAALQPQAAQRTDHLALAHESTLLVIGGQGGGKNAAPTDVLAAPLAPVTPDQLNLGGVVAWENASGLPGQGAARRLLAAAATSTALYVAGGLEQRSDGSFVPLGEVWVAPLGPNGQGAFAQTSFLNTARSGLALVAHGGFVYAIGGTDSQGNTLGTVEAAAIKSDGTLAAFNYVSTLPPGQARTLHAAVVVASTLYVVGGAGSNNVYSAQLKGDGTLGPWGFAQTLPQPRKQPGAVAYRGRLYVVGGDDGTGVQQTAWVADVNSATGGLGPFRGVTDMPGGRSGMGLIAADGMIFTLGGNGALSDVLVAPINADGSLGQWSLTAALNPMRADAGSAFANGMIYIVGGIGQTGNLLQDALQAAVAMPALRGAWSGVVGFAQPLASLDSLTLTGTPSLPEGIATVEWMAAGADGVFGASGSTGSISGVQFGAPLSFPAVGAQSLWLRVTLDETTSGTADAAPAQLTAITLGVRSGAPARLKITSAPQTVVVGACSPAVAVELQDQLGRPVPSPGSTGVALSGDLAFFFDAGCNIPAASVTMGPGATSVNLYFEALAVGPHTLNVASSGLASDLQIESGVVGQPARLSFRVQPTDVQVGAPLSPAVQVALFDGQGNLVPGGGYTVTLGLVNGGGASLSGTLSAVASGGVATFPRVSLDRAGVGYRLTATSQPALEPAQSRSFQVLTGPVASRLQFTTAAQTVEQGKCSQIATVALVDGQGRPANAQENVQVQLLAQSNNGAIFLDATCTTGTQGVTIGAGASRANFYFRGSAPGSLRILANSAGLQDASQDETISAHPDSSGDNGHRTINGFACSTSGGQGRPGALLALCAVGVGLWLRRAGKKRGAALGAAGMLLAAGTPARADEAKGAFVAVLELHNRLPRRQRAQVDASYLTDVVRSSLLRDAPGLRLMSHETQALLLKGLAHRQCGESCDLEFGRRLKVDYVVSGDVVRLGATYKVALKLLSVADGRLVSAAEGAGKSADELDKNARDAVRELAGPLRGDQPAPAAAEKELPPPLPLPAVEAEAVKPNEGEKKPTEAEKTPGEGEKTAAQEPEVAPPLVTAELPPPLPVVPESRPAAPPPAAAAAAATLPLGAEVSAPPQPAARRWYIPDLLVGAIADPAARTVGQEAAVIFHPAPLWALQLGLTISPEPGVRAAAYRQLAQLGQVRLSAGPQLHVVPVTDGVAFGGGVGGRAEVPLARWLDAMAGLALEGYSAPNEFLLAPLLQIGFIVRL